MPALIDHLTGVFARSRGVRDHLLARWLFLRALGLIYFSVFFALIFQICGLIGPQGILPAHDYLQALHRLGALRFWYAPTLLWAGDGNATLLALCWIGLAASVLLALNVLPRAMLAVCFACFLSFVAAAQDFSGYQSDGMLLEAGFLSLFLAPRGVRPGLGADDPPSRAAVFLLLWEWFRIYFESGVVKLESGDPTWRNLTALYEYYQNGPLPTWVGWYLESLPRWFHIGSAALTLGMELVLVWMALLPRRFRIACFCIVTGWQIGVIASANYAFLNYLVLILALLLLDDRFLRRFVPGSFRRELDFGAAVQGRVDALQPSIGPARARVRATGVASTVGAGLTAVVLSWIFYASCVPLVKMFWRGAPLPAAPVVALDPLRIANQYGLFAVMTPHRYEIEFQGSEDGERWTAYPFRYKPQGVKQRPRIFAPYQPRFDWNLWFASLGVWDDNAIVVRTEETLLLGDRDVLGLFAANPFARAPPRYVRAVLWQYWFSSQDEKRTQGAWWRRQLLGTYAPTLTRVPDGHFGLVAAPTLTSAMQP